MRHDVENDAEFDTIATRHTARFVERTLAPAAALLEVGCGEGQLAVALMRCGFDVTGIDADAACVSRATARGVRAIHAAWPHYAGKPVDATAFTRSLHRMAPLSEALRATRRVLRPGGALLVEDFAYEAADADTLRWFADVVGERAFAALRIDGATAGLLGRVASSADPLAAWRTYHLEHGVHDGATMCQAIGAAFSVYATEAAPYLYRLFAPHVASAGSAAFIADVFERETQAIAAGTIRPVGLRVVARA